MALDGCSLSLDLAPLARVTLLSLRDCTNLFNFAALGARQHFLNASGCLGLKDEDLAALSSVRHLLVDGCPQLTSLAALRDNLTVSARRCFSLEHLLIELRDGVSLDLTDCSRLKTVILGETASLHLLRVSRRLLSLVHGERVTWTDWQG